jgi:putative ABC transport system permease protein
MHVSLESISALHLDWVGGAPLPGVKIPAEFVAKFDLRPKQITAALVGLKQRGDVFRMQRFVNQYRGEPLLAVLPGVALDELWQGIALLERTLLAVSALVVLVGLAGLAATLLAGLNERRRELAILRALGAGPGDMFLMLTAEGVLVTAAGALLGLVLLTVASSLAAPWLLDRLGVVLGTRWPGREELALIGAVIATGLVASLIPGWRAWRMSLADGLTPKL